ncbi:MAG: hypothetical protein ABSA76_15465 [Bacteroidales bacterium]
MRILSIKWFPFVFFLLEVIPFTNINAQLKKYQIIDSKSRNGIPYAYIKIIGNNIIEKSDQDGCFSLPSIKDDSIQISHIAYKTIRISYAKIKNKKFIEMEELPIEMNPIIISAKNANSIVNQAIDSSFRALYTPMYFNCYRRDRIVYRDTLVAEALAEIIFELKALFEPSHGGVIKNYLTNIKVYRNAIFKGRLIPEYNLSATFSPFNRFIIGVSKDKEKLEYFSKQEVNDSIFVININPISSYKPNKNFILKSGRFIINKTNWKIIRIDTNIKPELLKASREENFRRKRSKNYLYDYSFSLFFDDKGVPSKIYWNYKFSFLENDPEKIWENHTDFIIVNEKNKPIIDERLFSLKSDTSLVQMNSKFLSGFEEKFNSIFKIINIEKD